PIVTRSVTRPDVVGRGQNGETRGCHILGRSGEALHILVRGDWRLFSRTFLFRSGPVAGATIPRRRLAQREPSWVALQRCGEGAHAIFHSVPRRDCLHVLPIRKATGLFQSAGLSTCSGERSRARVGSVTDAI